MSQAPTCIHGSEERGIFCPICRQERGRIKVKEIARYEPDLPPDRIEVDPSDRLACLLILAFALGAITTGIIITLCLASK